MIRDYSLLGPSAKDAEEKGLAAAKWNKLRKKNET
jgi:hypothetical protein